VDVFKLKTPCLTHGSSDHSTLSRIKAPSPLFFLSPKCYRVHAKTGEALKTDKLSHLAGVSIKRLIESQTQPGRVLMPLTTVILRRRMSLITCVCVCLFCTCQMMGGSVC